jgi:hypothetical protein
MVKNKWQSTRNFLVTVRQISLPKPRDIKGTKFNDVTMIQQYRCQFSNNALHKMHPTVAQTLGLLTCYMVQSSS